MYDISSLRVKCGNDGLGPIKCGKFRDQLRICWLLKKDSAQRS